MISGLLSADCIPKSAKIETDGLGNVVSVWTLQEDGTSIIQAAYRGATGSEWSTPQQLSVAGNTTSSDPKIAINSQGQVVVVWRSRDLASNKSSLYSSTVALQGTAVWTSPALVSDPSESLPNLYGEVPYSVTVSENGKATILWQTVLQEYKSSTSTVSDGVNMWTPPVLVVGTSCP